MGNCLSSSRRRRRRRSGGRRREGSEEVREKYKIDFSSRGKLGAGAYSNVYRCYALKDKEECAVKVIRLSKMAADELAALKAEVEILREINHPNIVKLLDYFEDESGKDPMAYIVTEILEGGELFDRIVERTFYSEYEARKVIQILLDVVVHLHEKNIAHRDLKPENLLLKSQKDDHSLKVADFGFAAKCLNGGKTLSTQCGTPNYVAPEIIRNEKYGCEVDMWSIGVLTFVLLGGYPPFHHEIQSELFRRIKNADYRFDPQYWNVVTEDAKDFIRKLIVPSPAKRLTASQAMVHPWLLKGDHHLVSRHLNTITNLQAFNAKRKFRAVAKSIITARRLHHSRLDRGGGGRRCVVPVAPAPSPPPPPSSDSACGEENR